MSLANSPASGVVAVSYDREAVLAVAGFAFSSSIGTSGTGGIQFGEGA